jgi:glycosyltransferase involved in cell wall biosynthesis
MRLNNLIDNRLFSISPSVSRRDIVIVGALSARKSLDFLVPVVKELQHIKFNFIGRVEDPAGDSARRELSILQNVVLRGQIGRVQTLQAMAAAKALVNTSLVEGFPNTFLEAWILGTPVISLFVDPGGVIKANRLGYVCQGDLERFRSLIQQASYDIDLDHCRQYALTNHSVAHAVDTIRSVLAGQLQNRDFSEPT